MMFARALVIAASLMAFTATSYARPVSYPDGWTLMQRNNGDRSLAHIHYSPTAFDSIGLYVEQNWAEDVTFTGLQYNRLLKRWNGEGSQANLYAKVGAGQADPFGAGKAELSGFAGFAADWETRRWFASYEMRATDYAGNKSLRHSGRAGVAPYIGDFGDLHTWLMVQVDHHPEGETPVTTTPLVRFFKGVQMVELGYTVEEKEFLFNWIVRF